MPLEIGNTFVNKSTHNTRSHLWIIISYPFGIPEKVVIVNLTSWRTEAIELNDASCIVNVGEHRFITGKNYISYRDAKFANIKDLEEAISKGLVSLNEDCSDEFLNKILTGITRSPFTSLGIIPILQQQELI